MMGPVTRFRFRSVLAAGALLAALGAAPANAASFTVFWDRADFGLGAGIGVSEATALQANNEAGIQIFSIPSVQSWDPAAIPVDNELIEASLVLPSGGPATITSTWTATNNDPTLNNGGPSENLYLVYVQPIKNTIVLDGQSQDILYDPADVGLTLNSDEWVLFQLETGGNTVYLPAVSLGALDFGSNTDYSLFYTLHNPQVFGEIFNDELGMPKWTLAFATAAPIPEPSSGLLMFIGLLGIAQARRKRS